MSEDTLQPLRLQLRGCMHMVQGWLLRDRQQVLKGRYELLLGQIGQVRHRVAPPADGPHAPVGAGLSSS